MMCDNFISRDIRLTKYEDSTKASQITFSFSVMLQMPKFSKGYAIEDFKDFIREHVGVEKVVSFGRLGYPNEWQLQVTSRAIREKLIQLGRTRINGRSCWIKPVANNEVRGYVHWLPNEIPNEEIEKHFNFYGNILFIEKDKTYVWDKNDVFTSSRKFSLFLNSDIEKEDVPHSIFVNNYRGLVTIKGRDPECLHCGIVGHRKVKCPNRLSKLNALSSKKSGSKIQNNTVKFKKPEGDAIIEKPESDDQANAKIEEPDSDNQASAKGEESESDNQAKTMKQVRFSQEAAVEINEDATVNKKRRKKKKKKRSKKKAAADNLDASKECASMDENLNEKEKASPTVVDNDGSETEEELNVGNQATKTLQISTENLDVAKQCASTDENLNEREKASPTVVNNDGSEKEEELNVGLKTLQISTGSLDVATQCAITDENINEISVQTVKSQSTATNSDDSESEEEITVVNPDNIRRKIINLNKIAVVLENSTNAIKETTIQETKNKKSMEYFYKLGEIVDKAETKIVKLINDEESDECPNVALANGPTIRRKAKCEMHAAEII